LVSDPAELEKLLKIADQAAIIIEKNIVQGVKNSKNAYSLQLNENKEINDNNQKQPAQKI
jgi:hypothetical protein